MGEDRTDPEPDGSPRVPIDAFPDPIAGYELDGERPVVAATNGAFEAAFGAHGGTPVRRWLRTETEADETTIDEICAALAGGDGVDTEVDAEPNSAGTAGPVRYRLRTLDRPSGGTVDGYVLVTESGTDALGADRIASVVSHDLRNPLDVAKAHLRAARETGADEHLDEVGRSHDRMERIIRDVLTLARGESALDAVDGVDLAAVATDAWTAVDTGPAALSVGSDLPTVEADPDRLQRLFENLFRNAVEHGSTSPRSQTPEDSVEHTRPATDGETKGDDADPDRPLDVRVGRTDDGFFVADDGVGIPAAERDRVFDPGYSSNGTGTGLGLTIVERIAEAHGWTVSVATGASGGARFEFRVRPDGESADETIEHDPTDGD